MRIVQLISHYVPAHRFGGPQQVAHGLGRALVRQGHEVTVCTTNLADENRNLAVPLDTPVELEGVRVYYEATKWSRFWGYSPDLARRGRQEIESSDLVLVHFHYQYANYIGAKIARAWSRPYFIFAHGSFRTDAMHRRSPWKKKLYLRTLENSNLRNAKHIIYNAPEEAASSLEFPQACVLPNGLEPRDYQPWPEAGAFRQRFDIPAATVLLVYLGRLDYVGKGLDLLLPALQHGITRDPTLHLVIAGPDERGGGESTRRRVSELGLDRHVTFPGLVVGPEKLALLRDADALLLPSRSEGLSITVLEALHLGIPLLITDRVGLHDTVQRLGAGVVVAATEPGVRAGLINLLDERRRSGMRNAAREWIQQHHTWDAVADRLVALARPSRGQ